MIFGGSSVYNLKLNTMQSYLESSGMKNTELINLGGNSYGTTRIHLLIKEMITYLPDLVILYTGHNEFEEKFVNDKIKKWNNSSELMKSLLDYSATFRALKFLGETLVSSIGKMLVEENNKGKRSRLPITKQVKWGVHFNKDAIYLNYRLNLKMILNILNSKNIPVILNTVAYNREKPPYAPLDKKAFGHCMTKASKKEIYLCQEQSLDKDREPHRATENSNNILKAIAKEHNVIFNDIDRQVKQDILNSKKSFGDYFDDHCHLNPEANIKFLEKLWASQILQTYKL